MRSVCRTLIKLREYVQVELHGNYSATRTLELAKYARSTSWIRGMLVLLGTPSPVWR